MPFLLFGLLALILGVYLLRQLGRASPARVVESLRMGGGMMAAAAAVLVLLRGRLPLAIGFGGLSLYLFSGEQFSWSKLAQQAAKRRQAKRRSQVRTAFLEMTLDHASGAVDGIVLAGAFAGASLGALSREEILRLRDECAARDPDSGLLVENYLDRRFPGWRAAGEGDANAGGSRTGRASSGEMTEQEAYQALGLRSGASRRISFGRTGAS
jgi:hypothetical protein